MYEALSSDARVRYGQHDLVFELYDSIGRTSTLKMPYATWTHPRGCLGDIVYAALSYEAFSY